MKLIQTIVVAVSMLVALAGSAQPKEGYRIVNHIKLDGDAGWDYIYMDEVAGLLYVSHGTMVQVVDVKTTKQVALIPDTKGVHGIAIATLAGKGYISCGKDSAAVVFDIKSHKTLAKVQVGSNPDAILYDGFSKRVFVFNGRSKDVSVIDTKTDQVIGTIALDGKPEFSASDEQGKVYVNIEDKAKLCVIDAMKLKVIDCWAVAPADEPSGLAIDNVKHRLFTVSDKNMVVLDATTGKIIAKLPIGEGVDGVAWDAGLKRAYSANGDGTMTVVQEDGDSYKVRENVPTKKGARTIAVDNTTHQLYLPTADYGPKPEPTADKPHPRAPILSGTFEVLQVAPVN